MLVLIIMKSAAKNIRFLSVSVICCTDRNGLNLYIKNAHINMCNPLLIARMYDGNKYEIPKNRKM